MQKVSVIIPAYNEDEYIINEIDVLKSVSLIDEIILVNDCSESKFAKLYEGIDGIKLINNQTNLGKGPSLQEGIATAKNDEILILDADLTGLTSENMTELLLFCKDYEIVSIIRGADSGLFKILGTTYLTLGEHYFKKSILNKFEARLFDGTRWGFDNNINDIIDKDLCKHAYCEIKTLNHIMKAKKYNPIFGIISDIKMGFSVIVKKYKIYKYIYYRFALVKKIKARKII